MRMCTILDEDDIIQVIANYYNVDKDKVCLSIDNCIDSSTKVEVLIEEPHPCALT